MGNILINKEKLDAMVEALRFYADKDSYTPTWVSNGCSCCDPVELPPPIEQDGGDYAIDALAMPNFVESESDIGAVADAIEKEQDMIEHETVNRIETIQQRLAQAAINALKIKGE